MALKPVKGKIESQELNDNFSYLDSAIKNIDKGSPKGVYDTVQQLKNAHPNGDSGIYIVGTNWYFWSNSEWKKGGVYQAQALGIRDVQRENIAIEAVSPVETNFFVEDSENVFDGVYIKAVYTFDAGKRDEFFLTANGYFNHDGRVVVFPVEPNEVYTIKFHEPHDMFRLGIHDDEIEIPETVA